MFRQRCFHSFQRNTFQSNLKSLSPFYSSQYWWHWQRFWTSPHFPGCSSPIFTFLPVVISQKQCLKSSILKTERRASKQFLTHSQLTFHNNIRTSLCLKPNDSSCPDTLLPWVMMNAKINFFLSKYNSSACHWPNALIITQLIVCAVVDTTQRLFWLRKTQDSREPLHNESEVSHDFGISSGNGKYSWKNETRAAPRAMLARAQEWAPLWTKLSWQ